MYKLLLTLTLFSCFSLVAQEKVYAEYDAYSGLSILANPPNENGYENAYVVETGSLYFDGTKSLYQQLENKTKVIRRIQNGVSSKDTVFRDNWDSIGRVYHKDFNTKKLLSRDCYFNKKTFSTIEENIPEINWRITIEKKTIAGYECVKANADFLGREWEAWFTYKIPISLGPWKLAGLPGLILEARDSKLDFIFKIQKIKLPAEFSDSIITDKYFNQETITREEFNKLNEKKIKKYKSYIKSLEMENDATIDVKFYPSLEVQTKNQ